MPSWPSWTKRPGATPRNRPPATLENDHGPGLAAHVIYLRASEKAYYKAQAAGTLTVQLTDHLADARKLVCHAAKVLFPAEAMTLEARNAAELERLAAVVRALRGA